MSIGAAFQWPQYPTAQAADRLVRQGHRRRGLDRQRRRQRPVRGRRAGRRQEGDRRRVVRQHRIRSCRTSRSRPTTRIGYVRRSGAPLPPTSRHASRWRAPARRPRPNDGCNALPAGSLTGKVALIRRGTCGFFVKAFNAQTAGAAGVVFYNNAAGPHQSDGGAGARDGSADHDPGRLDRRHGGRADQQPPRGGSGDHDVDETSSCRSRTRRGGLISSFSSYGLAPDLTLKPDIGAPGGLIRSTWPLEKGGYAIISGTSMASPHVAGAAALLLQAHPRTSTPRWCATTSRTAPTRSRGRATRRSASSTTCTPGRRHARHRRRDPGDDGGHARQALAGRERGRPGDATR